VHRSAVQALTSADIDDVPVIVRFLLQTVTSADAQMVLVFSSVFSCNIRRFKTDESCRVDLNTTVCYFCILFCLIVDLAGFAFSSV